MPATWHTRFHALRAAPASAYSQIRSREPDGGSCIRIRDSINCRIPGGIFPAHDAGQGARPASSNAALTENACMLKSKTSNILPMTFSVPEEGEYPVIMTTIHQGQIPIVVGVIDAGTLTDRSVVPRRDTRRKTGYQRDLTTARVNRLARELTERRVDLPTAVLLNVRDFDADEHLVEREGGVFFNPGTVELYVVDGQHRIGALEKLVQENPERWGSFAIPFVCMLGADERQEMREFYVVNSNAKSVRTDLALDLLKQQAESDKGVMDALIERGEDWKVKAQTLVEMLAGTTVWGNRIRFPRDAKGDTTISSSGMAGSIKSLLHTPYFGQLTTQNQIKILDAFWRGVRDVLPEVFADPSSYSLQKSVGVFVMHGLLISVLEYLRTKGASVIEPGAYAKALQDPLQNLQGDTTSGDLAQGADFWLAGPEGAAGSFSSGAGQRVLIARLKGALPVLDVE